MKASDLIRQLSDLIAEHGDWEVWCVWDGEPRTQVQHVWKASGDPMICMADYDDVVYSKESRPDYAPKDGTRWTTPKQPIP